MLVAINFRCCMEHAPFPPAAGTEFNKRKEDGARAFEASMEDMDPGTKAAMFSVLCKVSHQLSTKLY